MREFSVPIQIKRAAPEQGRFVGLAATWAPDRQADQIERGAFAKTLADFEARGARIPLLWNHDPAQPIGAIESATETDAGLEVAGVIALDSERGREAHALLKTGGMSLSIGFTVSDDDWFISAEGTRVITTLTLLEISVVAVPANAGAVVRDVKTLIASPRSLESALREKLGLTHRQAKRLVASGYAGLVNADDRTDEPNGRADIELRESLVNLRKAFE